MSDFGTAVAGNVTGKLVDSFLELIWIQITRVFKWESNVNNLKKKAEKLAEEREHVLQFTEAADRRGEEVTPNVKNWQTRAEEYKGVIEELRDNEDKAKKKCFAGLCPNPKVRYQISKKVEKYLKDVDPLLDEARGFKLPVSYCPPPEEKSTAAVEGFEQFDSRKPTLTRVMEALRSATVDKIGIHGLPGVGKTMLAKEVARQAKEAQLFDVIVMASVNKDKKLEEIQGEIADKLGLRLHGETKFGRAYELKAYLKKKKKILVILDDIWARLDLNDLGIPFEDKKNEASSTGEEKMQRVRSNEASSTRDEKMQHKSLRASRYLDVLSCGMGTYENIQVGTSFDLNQLGIPFEDKKYEASLTGEEQMQYKILLPSRDIIVSSCDMGTHENIQVGTRLDLDQHGIPLKDKKNEASSTGEEQMQCKILLTSRDLDVLSRDMGIHDENIQKVGTLRDEEAWTLLKRIVGDEVKNSKLLLTARKIAEKCAGLPLAVEAVAKALKSKEAHVWRDALRQLERPSEENFTGIPANVYSAIELSYNHLQEKVLKQTFLLCCLLGHNSFIGDLLTYGIGLELFPNVKTTEEARDRVLTLVSKLKSSSLLLDGRTNSHFDMHDIVHDVAISIAIRDHHMLSVAEDHIPKEWSDREALEDFKWIGLQYANISGLPEELECPQLTLFFLYNKDPSMKIPENLFRRTQKLKVLDFTNMCFSSLPSSICLLKNLRTLHVNGSVLEDMAIIGKLTSLEVLSLSGSDIVAVPTEIGQLTQLKLLDLSDCTKLKMIQPHVLARLSKLEELYLRNSFDQWDVDEGGNQRNASLAELKDLHNLAALDVHVCDVQKIPKDLFFERLERYKIFIGEVGNRRDSSFKSSKILKLELNTSISYHHSIGMLLKKTEELHLEVLKGFKNVVNELEAAGFQELKYLHVENAPEVQHIVNSVACVFPSLEELFLQNLNNLVKICHGQFGATAFSKLSIIAVKSCNQLKNLFPFSVARQLHKLKEIRVTECSNMTEIVHEELKGVKEIAEASENFKLVQLRSLQLQYLPKFIRLCHGNEETNDSSSNSSPLFHEKIVFPNLEELQLSCINIKNIWGSQLSIASSCIQSLTKLIIEGCDHLEHLLSSSIAKSLLQLKCLEIKKCKEIREIIEPENAEDMEDLISFPKLEILKIEHLEKHTGFYSGNCNVEFPALKRLFIENCPELKGFTFNHTSTDMTGGLETLFNDKVQFSSFLQLRLYSMNMQQIFNKKLSAMSSVIQSIGHLFLGECGNLKYLFTSSMIKSLGQLQFLEIRDCKMMKEVIVTEGLAGEEVMLFPNLETIMLDGLPELTRFCHGNCSVFPSLTRLDMLKCPLLETFISCPAIGDVTTSKRTEKAYKSPLFDAKIAFPCLERLTIIGLENLRFIWHHQPPADLFCKLKSLVIGNCGKLLTIFSSDILGRLCKSLELLKVFACGSLQEIFELGEVNIEESHSVLDTLLRELTIDNLPRLKYVWTKDPRGILSFRSLQSVRATNCPNLQNMFSASMAMEFQQLEELRLISCGIEEVVAFGGEEAAPRFVFSRLSTLYLWNLPRLKCFYPGKHVTEWPMLKIFLAYHFEGIKETNVIYQKKRQNKVTNMERLGAFPVQLPLFPVEKVIQVIPRLEKLSLTSDDIAMICTCQFSEDLFSNVKVLHVLCYHEESSVFPFFFIEKFFNLEELIIGCSYFKELFPSVASIDCQQKDARRHLRIIRKLKLDALPNLKYIWSQDSASDLLVQNVESLEVLGCHNLISLSESTTSFRNLTTLLVERCQGLRNLFSFATAQNMVQLQNITVENCHCLTEIVGGEGDGLEDVIVFSKLKVLKLKCSTRLTSFCSANFTFQFPLLEEVMVVQCPNFETFCRGVVRTPSLQRIKSTQEDKIGLQRIKLTQEDNIGHPVVELNDTINQLYEEKVGYTGLEYLKLSDFPQLVKIWNKNPQEILDFKQLCVLEICNCSDLRYLLTLSMALRLVSLKEMEVKYCKMMEQIITEEEATEVDEKEITFPLIETINLESCPNLTSFCVGNYKLECPSLSTMKLLDCPKMVTLASTFSTVQVKEAAEGGIAKRIGKEVIDIPIAPLFSDQVEFSSFLQLSLSSMNMPQIFNKQLSTMSSVIRSVGNLFLAGCGNLKYLFTSSMIKSLGQLQLLEIRDCKMMKEVIMTEGLAEEEIMLFPNLGILRLECLPKLTRFYSGNYFVFPSLTLLDILNCPLLETFISSSTIGDTSHVTTSKRIENDYKSPLFDAKVAFPYLEVLRISGLENLRVIWHHQLPVDSFCKLKSLVIRNCGKLLTIFPSDILRRLCKSLEVLNVAACGSLEEIFELGEVNIEESHGVLDTLLRELTIENLPRLKHVWTKDPRGILNFQNLQSVMAVGCPDLESMFPASVAMEFQQLEELGLINCGIKQVVAFGGEEAVPTFVFSRLSTLSLGNLPRLTCFYPGKHVTEWPMLKIFLATCLEGNKETNAERLDAFPVRLPLFTVEKVIPKLEKLSLRSDDIAMICNRQFPEDLFSNVKVLRVLGYHDESSVFPFFFIERFFNLEKLYISCSSFKELFSSVASIDCLEKDVGCHLRIRKLTLHRLYNLKYIWNQGSPSDLLVPNLKSLKVVECDSLISLSESTASFLNLTTLCVMRCQRLRNLFSTATAQSLVHLQKMMIEQCNLLSEIVGDEGDGLEDVIVFSKLKVLKLKCLERLASFCSANFTFKFPLLEEVMVVQCPNFETFCHGVVKTPSLQRIQSKEEDNMGHPVVELNNTINQLYKEMVGYAGFQILKLSDFPQLMEIWNKNPQEIMDFRQLHELEICNCGNLTYLLTPSMALSLVTLKMLKVENSAMMEHIITEEGAMQLDENEMTFPQLKTISLDSCSNLTSFFVGNYKLVFPSLAAMEVLDCPKMVTFASTFSTVQVKEAAKGESAQRIRKEDIDPTEPFFSDQVSFPHLSLLLIHGMGSLNMIWDNQLDADSFYRLQLLFVTSCEKLLNIFPITMLGRLQNLGVLEIVNCVSLEKIFQHQGPSASESQALKSSQSTMVETAINFVFPKVRYLTLARLPNLKSVCPQMHTTEWPSLETLVVLRCNQLRILASELLSYQGTSEETQLQSQNEHPLFWVNKASFPNLEKLIVERNDSMKEIWHGDDVKDDILFSKLETLKLKVLPRLKSFCSGGCNLEFRSLKDVIVMECPNLLTFSEGKISTPKLQKVKLTEDEDERYRADDSKRRILVIKKGMKELQKLGICMQNKEDEQLATETCFMVRSLRSKE